MKSETSYHAPFGIFLPSRFGTGLGRGREAIMASFMSRVAAQGSWTLHWQHVGIVCAILLAVATCHRADGCNMLL